MSELCLRNRQRVRMVDLSSLRRIARTLLVDLIGVEDYELGVHLVAAPEMARINRQFLHHEGSTDVIAFGYTPDGLTASSFYGEIFICLDDAVTQARQFHTTWESELVRYLVHGVLHLLGHDDLRPRARRVMKREEARLFRALEQRFTLRQLCQVSPGASAGIGNLKSTVPDTRRRFPLSIHAHKPRVRP